MFDPTAPVTRKTFLAIQPIGHTANEKIPFPLEWRLELFESAEPSRDALPRCYADKIQPGETLGAVLERVMRDVFRTTRWEATAIREEGDVPDRNGSSVPRIRVEVAMNPDETGRAPMSGLYPVWIPNSRRISPQEREMLAEWNRTFLSTSRQIFQKEYDGSVGSLRDIDATISSAWGERKPQAMQTVVCTFGAYLGDIIARETGGAWTMNDGTLMVEIPRAGGEQMHANVFSKTWKRVMSGEEDSLWYYAVSTIRMAKDGIPT
ncbi:MAG: hypothetical protein WCO25_02650 [Candidatus Uhrbacteria bacterium]